MRVSKADVATTSLRLNRASRKVSLVPTVQVRSVKPVVVMVLPTASTEPPSLSTCSVNVLPIEGALPSSVITQNLRICFIWSGWPKSSVPSCNVAVTPATPSAPLVLPKEARIEPSACNGILLIVGVPKSLEQHQRAGPSSSCTLSIEVEVRLTIAPNQVTNPSSCMNPCQTCDPRQAQNQRPRETIE